MCCDFILLSFIFVTKWNKSWIVLSWDRDKNSDKTSKNHKNINRQQIRTPEILL